MSDNLVISIDAMGGDNSPRVVIEGLAIAAKKNPDAKFLLFGDETKVNDLLKSWPALQKSVKCAILPKSSAMRTNLPPSFATATPACLWRLTPSNKARRRLSFRPETPEL